MRKSLLNIRYLYLLLLAVPVVLLFQNCGQNGSVELENVQESIKTGPNEDPDNTQNENGDDVLIVDPDSQKAASVACSDIAISDFILKAKSVSSGLELSEEEKTISFNKQTLSVKATRDITVKHLTIILNEVGNQVLDLEGKVYNLKTPSAQASGLKVHLTQEASLLANKTYLIKFSINMTDQIVTNPSKCIFKPVIRNAELALVE